MTTARARAWAGALVLVGVAAALVRLAAAPLHNLDTYFHLRFGHEFLSGAWSLRDPGSVSTFGTADWVPTQWLPQVVMAQTEDWFGLPGVAWLSGLFFVALAVAVYAAARARAEPLVAAVVTVLVVIACSSGLSMRPQMISYVLVAVTAAAWLRARDTGRAPWLLVPLTWVWTTCHGMWPTGIVIGLVAVAGLALDRELRGAALARMLAVPVLSTLVSLLTPVGPGLFPAVLRVTSRAKYFGEWGPPDFHRPSDLVLLVVLAAAVVPHLARGQRVPWTEVALLGLAATWAVYSQRTVPVAACLLAPLAAAALQPVLGARPAVPRRERLLVLAGSVVSLALLAVLVPHTSDEPRDEPTWVDEQLGAMPEGTVVISEIGHAGYLMWRFPQLDLVLSGYGDIYTDAELERNADIEQGRGGWVELVRETGADYAIVPPGTTLAYDLRQVEHWSVVDQGGDLQLLAPPPGWMDP